MSCKPANMTNQMKESLDTLRSSLLCPLCNQLMVDTSMLNCGHSFCHGCIIAYTSDNWTCPVVGCNMPVSAGRERGTSYVKKNSQIESVISALLAIEQNIAPDGWWKKEGDDTKQCSVQIEEEGAQQDILDFQQMANAESSDALGSKRKCQEYEKQEDDVSSSTEDFEGAKQGPQTMYGTPNNANRASFLDSSLFESGKPANRSRVSCTVPSLFSQQFSPISMKNSQQSEPPSGIYDTRKTATASSSMMKGIYESSVRAAKEESKKAYSPLSLTRQSISPMSMGEKKLQSPRKEAITSDTKSRRSPRVSFQPRPRVMLLCPSWTLKPANVRCIRKCISDGVITVLSKHPTGDDLDSSFDFESDLGRQSFLNALSSQRNGNASPMSLTCYAISTEKDYSMDDGIVVPRSFPYYLAVACGMPIMDVGFLAAFSSNKNKRSSTHQKYPFPLLPLTGITSSSSEEATNFQVIGASDYSWNAPQKAQAAALERHQSWLKGEGVHVNSETLMPGTDLLYGYDIILLGEFDPPRSDPVAKRKKQKHKGEEMKKTRGSINTLLQLCGARVYDINSVVTLNQLKVKIDNNKCRCINGTLPSRKNSPTLKDLIKEYAGDSDGNNHKVPLIAMVKDSSCVKGAEEFLALYFSNSAQPSDVLKKISILTCDWLLDSIGEFDVKPIYANTSGVGNNSSF
ncbi:hypothetical protein HJC23_000459 [Cyclotella cryptica]|uniref:RING-type domain-containing protein n=1 Tax=Cyclotella cryptica TaxID=29204 RepID=A0ABD3QCB1_9STRA